MLSTGFARQSSGPTAAGLPATFPAEPAHPRFGLGADAKETPAGQVAFLIDPEGAWIQLGTPEAEQRLAASGVSNSLSAAIERRGYVGIVYSRLGVAVRLNPAAVASLALASLRPRLSVVEMAVDVTYLPAADGAVRFASGDIAMRRIEAEVKHHGLVVLSGATKVPLIGREAARVTAIGPGTHIVTDSGGWLREEDARLRELIGFADPAIDAVGYAIRNLGYIKVAVASANEVTVVLHPRNVQIGALNAAARQLAAMLKGRFQIRYLAGEGWLVDVASDGPTAARKLRALCGASGGHAVPRSRWFLTPGNPETLDSEGTTPFKLMQQKWRISSGVFTESVFAFSLRFGLLDRLILAGAQRPNRDLVFRYIGDGLGSFHSEEFRFNAIGNSILQQPDKEYAAWVAAAYEAVAASGVPRLDNIDAYLPTSSRGPWVRYERLLLPWKLPSGEVLISMCSRVTRERMLTPPEPP